MSWPVVKLSEVTSLITCGVAKRPEYVESGIPFLSAKNVKHGGIIYSGYNCVSEETHKVLTKHNKPEKGDILYTRVGSVGEAAIIEEDIEFSIFVSLTLIKPKHELIYNKYLKYLLNSEMYKAKAQDNLTGIGVGNLNVSVVREYPVPLPPLAEQKRIAAILDKADAIRRKRQQAIQLADDFLRAVFLEMFGDPVTNPKGWETKTIEQLISDEKYSLKRGPFGGALKKEIFVEKGYLVYEQYHALNGDFSYQRYFIDEDKFQELKAFEVKPKDIIVSCSGVNLGRLAEVPLGSPAGIINQALMKITLNQGEMLNELFIDIFSNPSFKTAFYGDLRGAAIPNFPPMATFREFKFIVPPLELQQRYVCIKNNLAVHSTHSENMDDLELFNALSQKAFSGQL